MLAHYALCFAPYFFPFQVCLGDSPIAACTEQSHSFLTAAFDTILDSSASHQYPFGGRSGYCHR